MITSNQGIASEDRGADEMLVDEPPVGEDSATQPGPRPRSRRSLRPLRPALHAPQIAAGVAVLLICALALLLANAGLSTASPGSAHTRPTATLAPTATPSPFPTPTAMMGFQGYLDRSARFYMQYPLSWEARQTNPGIQFDDDPNAPNYIVQVLLPGDATTAGPTTDPNDPAVWVRYEMNRLATIYEGSFSELPGPAPATHFGGMLWQSGVARLTSNTTDIRVQIFATVYNGTPYIINLLATQDRFATGVRAYFDPMLQSFTFLPLTNP